MLSVKCLSVSRLIQRGRTHWWTCYVLHSTMQWYNKQKDEGTKRQRWRNETRLTWSAYRISEWVILSFSFTHFSLSLSDFLCYLRIDAVTASTLNNSWAYFYSSQFRKWLHFQFRFENGLLNQSVSNHLNCEFELKLLHSISEFFVTLTLKISFTQWKWSAWVASWQLQNLNMS